MIILKLDFDLNSIIALCSLIFSIISIVISIVAMRYPYRIKLIINYCIKKLNDPIPLDPTFVNEKDFLVFKIFNIGNRKTKLKYINLYYKRQNVGNLTNLIRFDGNFNLNNYIEPGEALDFDISLENVQFSILIYSNYVVGLENKKIDKNINLNKKLTISLEFENGKRKIIKTKYKMIKLIDKDTLNEFLKLKNISN